MQNSWPGKNNQGRLVCIKHAALFQLCSNDQPDDGQDHNNESYTLKMCSKYIIIINSEHARVAAFAPAPAATSIGTAMQMKAYIKGNRLIKIVCN